MEIINNTEKIDIFKDIIIEGPEPENDKGYFIIEGEPNGHLKKILKGIPLNIFC